MKQSNNRSLTRARERRIARALARHGITIKQVRCHRAEILNLLDEKSSTSN